MTVRTVQTRSHTPEEKREHVLAYLALKYGTKAAYLEQHGISSYRIRSWQHAMADGDLDRGLIPRHTGSMSAEDVAEIRRLQTEVARLTAERDRLATERDRMTKAADALGKAIDVMQPCGVDSDEDGPH